jgi:hypothetical protein
MLKQIISFIHKVFTYNKCDTCGFTKNKVYVVEFFMEGGYMECTECIKKQNK